MTSKPRARASAKNSTPTKPRAASKRKAVVKTKPPLPCQPATTEPEPIPTVPITNVVPQAKPLSVTPVSKPDAQAEVQTKARKRGLGALSKHALSPVSAPLTLVTRPRPSQSTLLPSGRPSTALPDEAVNYLRAELTSLLAALEEIAP